MKVLYALQGTGNGHVSRARELVPHFEQVCDLDVAMTGSQSQLGLDNEPDYQLSGLSFSFGKTGKVDYLGTLKNLHPLEFIKDVKDFPIEEYDLLVNDFEPVTAWAAKRKGVPSVAMSNQAAFMSENTPRPDKRSRFSEFVLKRFAPTDEHVAFHYQEYDSFIHTPLIRSEVRELIPENKGHITVYLPAYGLERTVSLLKWIGDKEFEVFSKGTDYDFQDENVRVRPISNVDYLESLRTCDGLLTGAGFEAPSEALFLGKKLLVVPMRNQYEQVCNAEALADLGVPSVRKFSDKTISTIGDWAHFSEPAEVDFPDHARELVEQVIRNHE